MKRTEVAQYWEANAQTWTRHVRAGYDIYRDGLPLASVGPVTTYNDTTVAANTTYAYFVKAKDATPNFSDPSNTANVTTPSGSNPPAWWPASA